MTPLAKPLLPTEGITPTGGASPQATGSSGGAERVAGQPRQEQLHPVAAAPEAAAGAASSARPRAGWLLRQRQSPQLRASPTTTQMQTSENILPDASANQADVSSLGQRALGRNIALQQPGALFSQQQELQRRRSASQHELLHSPQMRDTAGSVELRSSEIFVAEAAPSDDAQAAGQAQDDVNGAASVQRVPQSDSPSGSAGSTRNALERLVCRASHSAPLAAGRASALENGDGVGDVHRAPAVMQGAASHPAAGELFCH